MTRINYEIMQETQDGTRGINPLRTLTEEMIEFRQMARRYQSGGDLVMAGHAQRAAAMRERRLRIMLRAIYA